MVYTLYNFYSILLSVVNEMSDFYVMYYTNAAVKYKKNGKV